MEGGGGEHGEKERESNGWEEADRVNVMVERRGKTGRVKSTIIGTEARGCQQGNKVVNSGEQGTRPRNSGVRGLKVGKWCGRFARIQGKENI